MSTGTWEDGLERVQASVADRTARLAAGLFGDRTGLTLFLGAITFFGLCWRQGIPINDNYTVLNALVAVADGHLYLDRVAFGPSLGTPGTVTVDGRVYGRNYGHVFLALPVLFGLRAIALVADIRILLAGGWSLCLLGTVLGVGSLLNRQRLAAGLGGGLALVAFLASVVLATDLPALWYPLIALQSVSAAAGALTGVVVYRLLARIHDRRLGIAGGIATVLAIPVGFWATIPKRHVLIACLAVAAAYLLYRSREAGDESPELRRRAGAYALPGLAAWIAAPEGVILGLAVAAVDLSTLQRVDLRESAVIAGATFLAFLPFFLTNFAIAGDPLTAPRYLPGYTPPDTGGAATSTTAAGGAGSGGGASSTTPVDPGSSSAGDTPSLGVLVALDRVFGQFVSGAATLIEEPGDVWRTFVRSGYEIDTWTEDVVEGANLSVLESAPLFAPLAGTVALGGRRLARRLRGAEADQTDPAPDPVRVADRFALVYAVLLTLAYIPRLPVHAQITVRYLVPMYPLLLYAVARLPAVRRAVDRRWQFAAWTYAGTVLIAGQLFLAGVTVLDLTNGQAMQTHAVVNLVVVTLLGTWSVAATLDGRREATDRYDDLGAVLLGLAAGAGTVLVLLATIAYFPTDGFLLPLVPSL